MRFHPPIWFLAKYGERVNESGNMSTALFWFEFRVCTRYKYQGTRR
jgi:hypothetical protein